MTPESLSETSNENSGCRHQECFEILKKLELNVQRGLSDSLIFSYFRF